MTLNYLITAQCYECVIDFDVRLNDCKKSIEYSPIIVACPLCGNTVDGKLQAVDIEAKTTPHDLAAARR